MGKEGYEEASPLIDHNEQQDRSPAPPQQAEARKWDGHLLNPFGRCDARGLGTCIITYYLPCVSFGQTQRRAFGKSALRAGITFGTLVVLSYLNRGLQFSLMTNDCLAEPPAPHHGMPRKMGPGFVDGAAGPSTFTHLRAHVAKPFFGAPLAVDKVDSEVCARLVTTSLALNLAFVAYSIFLFIWGARLRTQMREKFGIEGAAWKDVLAWLCCMPCAVCQESRTMAANNVDYGVWHGSAAGLPIYAAAETEAPSFPVMSAAKA